MSERTVTTQTELDQALADQVDRIYIDSPAGVWLNLHGSGRSRVVARGSSRVVARGSSQVEAWDSSQVEARDSSQVEARGSSRVMAWGSSHVMAWGSSRVVATPHVAIHLHNARASVEGGVVIDVSNPNDTASWLAHSGIAQDDGHATLFKAVDSRLVSGYGFTYLLGETVTAPDWRDDNDCGGGLHVSPTPRHALDYHGRGDESARFLAVRVAVADIRPIGWDKCKVPRLVVLHEVDVDGKPVAS